MDIWLITLIALWTYPILANFICGWAQRNNKLKSVSLGMLTVLALITLFISFDISTTSIQFDWILLTSYYFGLCFILWRVVKVNSTIVKVVGYTVMTIVFGIGYLLSTLGALGVGFVTAEFIPKEQKEIESGLMYKEIRLGNAVSDNRGVRIEIYRNYNYLPFIEKRISTNEYYGHELAKYDIVETYDRNTQTLHLTLDVPQDVKDKIEWNNEIKIE